MKAIRIHEFGGSDRVRLEDVPVPPVTDEKVLVHVRAAAVNPVDWMIREKLYNPAGTERTPLTLGQDFAGVVERFGPRAGGAFSPGDEVFGEAWGTFAEYALVPASDLVAKPRNIDFIAAAAIPMPALTAWQSIVDTAGAKTGMRILVHGASGGVGSFAAQLARWKGAEVRATVGAESFDFLRGSGITNLLDYRRARFEDEVGKVDVVLDPLGGDVQARSWAVLRRGGMLINLVGEIDRAAARKAGVRGVEFGMRYDTEDLREIAALVERGTVRPHVTHVLPLEQGRQGMDLNQQGRSHGKIVLEVPWAAAG
jgi:NADPH:quinone reductase-like Zn-dependent oxidoreductase